MYKVVNLELPSPVSCFYHCFIVFIVLVGFGCREIVTKFTILSLLTTNTPSPIHVSTI